MKLICSYASWRKYREDCEELQEPTEQDLEDLGITRGDIPFVVRRAI